MGRIIAISGSLRRGSYNSMLLRAATAAAPSGVQIRAASIAEFPLYNADVEAQGVPQIVRQLKDDLADSSGLLLVSPEYNYSVPGTLKNAIDWLSRPVTDIPRVFGGKPVAVMGASSGSGGTRIGQAAWLPVFQYLKMRPWFGDPIYVAHAAQVFDEGGHIVDVKVARLVRSFMSGFCEFALQKSAQSVPEP